MPRNGRIIDYINYDKNGVKLKVPIRLVKNRMVGYGRTDTTQSAEFCVLLPEQNVNVASTNVDDVVKQTIAALDLFYELKWKSYLHLIFSIKEESEKIHLALTVRTYLVAELRGGEKVHRRPSNTSILKGELDQGPDSNSWDGETMSCLVEATEPNKAKVEMFKNQLQAFGEQVQALFDPKVIERTLLGKNLLPYAPDDKKSEERRGG